MNIYPQAGFQKIFERLIQVPRWKFGLLLVSLVAVCTYPAFFVYFHNIREAALSEIYIPIVLFVAVGFAAWVFFGSLTGSITRGALVTVFFMLVFVNYALIEGAIRALEPDWRWWRIAPTFFFLFVSGALALRVSVSRAGGGDTAILKMVLAIGAIYCALTLFNAANGLLTLVADSQGQDAPVLSNSSITRHISPRRELTPPPGSTGKRPDFYFFIFDEYARQDVLKKYTGFDNTPFLNELENKRFNVSYSSRSSSYLTAVSTGNSLFYSTVFKSLVETEDGIRRPPLFEVFKRAGYRTYTYSPLYQIDQDLADVCWHASASMTSMSIEKTVLAASFVPYIKKDANELMRKDLLNLFKQVQAVIEEPQGRPKFLYCHIVCPHEPFIFDANGEAVGSENAVNWADLRYYTGQLRFISKRINELADAIRKKDPDAVVILQSDHSFRSEVIGADQNESVDCFNCLYLAGHTVSIEGLSSINTIRLALNYALGLELGME